MRYTGPESNRSSKTSEFHQGTKFHISDLIDCKDDEKDISILEIGCGKQQKFLKEISKDRNIQKKSKNKNIELFSISAEETDLNDNILHFTQFLTCNNGLNCLPSGLKFNYIFSSWCFNYFDSETFDRVLRDSLEKLKPNGQIDIFPFQPTRNTSEFPCGLNMAEYFKELFYSIDSNPEKIKERMKYLNDRMQLNLDIDNLEDNLYKLQFFFQENFLKSEILNLAQMKAHLAAKVLHERKEKILNYIVSDRGRYEPKIFKIGEDDCLSIFKKY